MNILVLGGNSDIGLAAADAFAARQGERFLLASRNEEELRRNASDLSIRRQVEVEWRYFDVREWQAHAEFYHSLPFKPDGVILAFGYNGDQPTAESDPEERQQILETNYVGAVHMVEVIARDFQKRSFDSDVTPFIAGISSAAGERGRAENYIYGSAKAGLTACLSGVRQRLWPSGVHVVTVAPGYVDTKMTAHLELPKPLTLSPEKVGESLYQAVRKGRNKTFVTWYWRCIATVLKLIPEPLFKRLFN